MKVLIQSVRYKKHPAQFIKFQFNHCLLSEQHSENMTANSVIFNGQLWFFWCHRCSVSD